MKSMEAIIAWNPVTTEIAVGRWPDETGWSDAYPMTAGACDRCPGKPTKSKLLARLFNLFNMIVVRDCIPAQAAHRAFLSIDEYRRAIAPDQLGAEDDVGALNKHWRKVVAERLDHE